MSEWALNVITSVLLRERQKTEGEGNVTTVTDIGVCGHKTKNAGSHKKLEGAKNRFSPRASGGSVDLLTP